MTEREQMKLWVDTWKAAGPVLEEIWRKEVAEADNLQDLRLLDSVIDLAVRTRPPEPVSGLVEMQAILAKLRR